MYLSKEEESNLENGTTLTSDLSKQESTKTMNTATIYKQNFRSALRAVALHMSKDNSRSHLNGMRVEFSEDSVRFVATDGHTLGMADIPCSSCSDFGEPILIQSDDIKALIKMLPASIKGPESVKLERSAATLAVTYDGNTRVCILNEQAFPQYQNVLPGLNRYLEVNENTTEEDGTAIAIPVVGLNPNYLARVGKACKEFLGKQYMAQGLEFRQANELDPVHTKFDCGTGTLVQVIMPMRIK